MKYYYNKDGQITMKGNNIVNTVDKFIEIDDDDIDKKQLDEMIIDTSTKKMSFKKIEKLSRDKIKPTKEISLENKRRIEYGSFYDQLDMLYHDIDDGLLGTNAKKSKWYKHIKDVKRANPLK